MRHPPPTLSPPELDIEKYRPYIESFDLSEKEQIELLESLWFIMKSFVEFGFGLDSIQTLLPDLAEFSLDESTDLRQCSYGLKSGNKVSAKNYVAGQDES